MTLVSDCAIAVRALHPRIGPRLCALAGHRQASDCTLESAVLASWDRE